MSNPIRVERNENGSYQLHLEVLRGSNQGLVLNVFRQDLVFIQEAISNQFNIELNDELSGFLDDDDCEGCKI